MRFSRHTMTSAPRVGALLALLLLLAAPVRAADSSSKVRVKAAAETAEVAAGAEARITISVRVLPGWHVNAQDPGPDWAVGTEVRFPELPEWASPGTWSYPQGKAVEFAFADVPLRVYEGRFQLTGVVRLTPSAPEGEAALKGGLWVQACNEKSCLRPALAPFEIALTVLPATAESIAASEAADAEKAAAGLEGNRIAGLLDKYGLLATLGIIFFWGLALCLTPCVFPMIPITAGFFSAQATGNKLKAFALALLYVLGLALTYGAMGTIAGLTGGMLGEVLRNPWVLVGVAVVLVVLALSMFGLYELRLPGASGARGRSGFVGAFVMGIFLGIVAAPCIGPASAALLAFIGYTGNPWFGFLAFFVLSLGLGMPFLVLAIFSELALPRGGTWMVWVKKFLGILILGLALWFVLPLLPDWFSRWALLVFALGGAIYLAFFERSVKDSVRFRVFQIATGVVIAALALWLLRPPGAEGMLQWQPYSDDALAAASSASCPAVIDFYADWCIPCKELEHTFAAEEVSVVMNRFVRLKSDMTLDSPETERQMERFGVVGVPTILFFDAKGEERLRLEEMVYPDDLLGRLETAKLLDASVFEGCVQP